ncbi:hypothetical protein [Actinosynnema sp. NPDC020468]|uniref:hypothetical protein n=1 Tax=Actinosynnema sp. NPDC020468 TaxID=3154488 RepID=UPI0033C77996
MTDQTDRRPPARRKATRLAVVALLGAVLGCGVFAVFDQGAHGHQRPGSSTHGHHRGMPR